jgi:hypothetical protein
MKNKEELIELANTPVKKLTEDEAKKLLVYLYDKLNDLGDDDFFGTEGWKHFFGLEK